VSAVEGAQPSINQWVWVGSEAVPLTEGQKGIRLPI